MKTWKIGIIASMLLIMVTGASASSLGSFASDGQKTVDSLEATFTISVFNTGDETISIEVKSPELKDASILHPEQMEIEPSEITSNPSEDSTWFLLSDGKYVETTEIPLKVKIDSDRASDSFDFDVTLRASTDSSSGGEGIIQSVSQERSYSFEVTTTAGGSTRSTDSSGSNTVNSGPETQDNSGPLSSGVDAVTGAVESFSKSFDGFGSEEDERDRGSTKKDQSEASDGQTLERDTETIESSTEPENPGDTQSEPMEENATGNFFQSLGVNSITILMMILLAGSFIYFVRVI